MIDHLLNMLGKALKKSGTKTVREICIELDHHFVLQVQPTFIMLHDGVSGADGYFAICQFLTGQVYNVCMERTLNYSNKTVTDLWVSQFVLCMLNRFSSISL